MKKLNSRGFTMVELLVVLVIIGILAGLAVNVINESRERASAAVASNTFRQVERAMYLKAIEDGVSEWWHENIFEACAGTAPTSPNPAIADMITSCGLDKYLQNVSDLSIFDNLVYDADGIEFTGCGDEPDRGVNLRLDTGVTAAEFSNIDNVFDKNDGANCGDIRYNAGAERLYFLLERDLAAFSAT